MAPVLVPNCALAEVRFTASGEACESTLWFERTEGTVNEESLRDLASYLRAWDVDNRIPILPTPYVHREVYIKGRDITDGYEATDSSAQGTTGAVADAVTPNNVSLSVSFRTGRTGRSRRGRNFWPLFGEAQVTSNNVLGVIATAIESAYNELIGSPPVGWRWVVVSLRTNNAPRQLGLITPITSVTIVDTVVDSMRRRLPGRGQ